MKQKICFLLGNGFSQGFGFPSMKQLWGKCLQLKNEDVFYKNILLPVLKEYPVSYIVETGVKDIELLLTVWKAYYEAHESSLFTSNASQSTRGGYTAYLWNLAEWLHFHTLQSISSGVNKNENNLREFREFIQKVIENYDVVFLTTNYDLVLEAALSPHPYHFLEEDSQEGSIPIRKLHGSIAWFYSGNTINNKTPILKLSDQEQFYDLTTECLRTQTLWQIQMQFSPQHEEKKPTIIPPLIGKEYGGLFSKIRALVENDLKNITHFIIVGYSFPAADPVIAEMIRELVPIECKVTYVNPDSEVCAKIRKTLLPASLNSRQIGCIWKPWTTQLLSEILNERCDYSDSTIGSY